MPHPTDRALQIAVEMERLGQTFYESLAEGCGNDNYIGSSATIH
jgi:rubrerythrin